MQLGTSAIHWACQLNHYSTAELLLKAGISRDARNKVDRTPLHVTATEGHVDILKLLLKHGVDVDAVDMVHHCRNLYELDTLIYIIMLTRQ